jgi:hypothetical protein
MGWKNFFLPASMPVYKSRESSELAARSFVSSLLRGILSMRGRQRELNAGTLNFGKDIAEEPASPNHEVPVICVEQNWLCKLRPYLKDIAMLFREIDD